jgi:hypothetical protein
LAILLLHKTAPPPSGPRSGWGSCEATQYLCSCTGFNSRATTKTPPPVVNAADNRSVAKQFGAQNLRRRELDVRPLVRCPEGGGRTPFN